MYAVNRYDLFVMMCDMFFENLVLSAEIVVVRGE